MFEANLLKVDNYEKSADGATPHRMTFMQFKTRDRGASRKYSTAAKELNKGDFGALTAAKGDKYELYDEETRRKRRKTLIIWFIVNGAVSVYIAFLLWMFWGNWDIDCIRKLNVWLLVYQILQGFHAVRTLILIIVWKRAKDPPYQQIKTEVFFGGWVFLAEAGWIIYGNTFIYSEQIKSCDVDYKNIFGREDVVDNLRISTMILIIYGYFLLLGILLLMCFYAGAYFGFKARMAGDKEHVNGQDGDEDVSGAGIKRSATGRMMDSASSNPTMMAAFTRLYTRKFTVKNNGESGNPLLDSGVSQGN